MSQQQTESNDVQPRRTVQRPAYLEDYEVQYTRGQCETAQPPPSARRPEEAYTDAGAHSSTPSPRGDRNLEEEEPRRHSYPHADQSPVILDRWSTGDEIGALTPPSKQRSITSSFRAAFEELQRENRELRERQQAIQERMAQLKDDQGRAHHLFDCEQTTHFLPAPSYCQSRGTVRPELSTTPPPRLPARGVLHPSSPQLHPSAFPSHPACQCNHQSQLLKSFSIHNEYGDAFPRTATPAPYLATAADPRPQQNAYGLQVPAMQGQQQPWAQVPTLNRQMYQSPVTGLPQSRPPTNIARQELSYRGPQPTIPDFSRKDPSEFARLKLALLNLLPPDATELFKYQLLLDHLKLEEARLVADSFINSVTHIQILWKR